MDKKRRKEIVAEYKQQKTKGGVYRIYNTETGRNLIKAEINLEAFKNRFDFSIKIDSCIMIKLQEDWSKYGSASFVLEILQETEMKSDETQKTFKDRLKLLEEEWKAKYDPVQLY